MTSIIEKIENWVGENQSFFFRYSILSVSFLLILQLIEILIVGFHHQLPPNIATLSLITLFDDFVLYSACLTPLFIIYFLLGKINESIAKWFLILFGSVFLFITFLLGQYFSVTFFPLGADFWAYSFSDIINTVKSSGGLSFGSISGLTVVLFLIMILPYFSGKIKLSSRINSSVFIFSILTIPLWLGIKPEPANFKTDSEYFLSENKARYFFARSFSYFFDTSNKSNLQFSGFPLYKKSHYQDVLSQNFTFGEKKPNIVFIIVEGLGADFITGETYSGFTPFIDSLSEKSLYWKNFLSATGRTFGVLPSLLASLPFGENGFMEMGNNMPDHQSLITLLESNGYYSRFFYGGDAGFDKIAEFMERQKTDEIIDEGFFPSAYKKSEANSGGFTWGYADGDLFKFSFDMLNKNNQSPYINIYLTISTHEPFLPPNKEYFQSEFRKRLNKMDISDSKKKDMLNYENIFASLLYTDSALRTFFNSYSKREDFGNTLFFITGDHRIIPIPQDTKIDRFHVPFILYSKMLKSPKQFSSVSSHLDVTPTVLSLLKQSFQIDLPDSSHWLGSKIDTTEKFQSVHSMAFMRSKGDISDYLDGNYFLSGDQLFEFWGRIQIESTENSEKKAIARQKLNSFKSVNQYVTNQNRIYPSKNKKVKTAESVYDDSVFTTYQNKNLDSDQLFQEARKLAFSNHYPEARAVCRKLLEGNSNFHDARTLLGRTFAWDSKYDQARECFQFVIKRSPKYSDAYFAFAQVEFWTDHNKESYTYIKKAVELSPDNSEFLIFCTKLLISMDRRKDALKVVDHLLKVNSGLKEAIDLKARLEPN